MTAVYGPLSRQGTTGLAFTGVGGGGGCGVCWARVGGGGGCSVCWARGGGGGCSVCWPGGACGAKGASVGCCSSCVASCCPSIGGWCSCVACLCCCIIGSCCSSFGGWCSCVACCCCIGCCGCCPWVGCCCCGIAGCCPCIMDCGCCPCIGGCCAPALVAVPPASRAVAAALGLQPQHVESQHFNNKPPENPTLLLLPMSTKKCDKEMGQAGKRKDMVENRCVNCKKHKNCNKRQELPDHNKLSGLPTATIARLNAIFGSGMTGVCWVVLQSTAFLAMRTQYGSWKADKNARYIVAIPEVETYPIV